MGLRRFVIKKDIGVPVRLVMPAPTKDLDNSSVVTQIRKVTQIFDHKSPR
jgi:hypothetical protein